MRGVVAIQIFMKTKQNKASHLVYIFPVPECYLLTQGESGLPRLHNSDYPPLLSLSYLGDLKVNYNFRGRESSGVGNVTTLSSTANTVFGEADLEKLSTLYRKNISRKTHNQ